MNEVPTARMRARLLEVRTVEVIAGRGVSVTLSSVRCPVRAESCPVEVCADCGLGRGIAQDGLARGEYACCGGGASERPFPPAREARATVGAVMRRSAVALRTAVRSGVAADALRSRGLAAAPVVDGDGRPVGMVSESDLLRAPPAARVAEAMTRVALAVTEETEILRALSLMAGQRVDRLAVVGADGVVVGVLAASDVVAWLAEDRGTLA